MATLDSGTLAFTCGCIMRPICVGDVFTIGRQSTIGWTQLPRTITAIDINGLLSYRITNGACHTISPQRLAAQINAHIWILYVPEHLTLPIGV